MSYRPTPLMTCRPQRPADQHSPRGEGPGSFRRRPLVSRRRVLAGAASTALLLPRPARAAASMKLTVMGQALIQHDLRQHPWPGLTDVASLLEAADVCFTDLETAIRNGRAG